MYKVHVHVQMHVEDYEIMRPNGFFFEKSLKKLSKYLTYNTCACVLQIKQGVHLANRVSKSGTSLAVVQYVPFLS